MKTIAETVGNHIGQRIRKRRILLGLTQAQLGAFLEVSYQQVQKYETGHDRVSVGRLYEIAKHLQCPVSWFFEELNPEEATQPQPHGGINRATLEVVRNFEAITDPKLKVAVSSLLKQIAEG